jgi:protein phosphatase 2C family protein 2/3
VSAVFFGYDSLSVIRPLGIWDCLTSQQCVDVVRLLISQGKELSEVGEIICEHCLAPDTASGAGIGCDNMTILIVAILHGRTKEEWYSWVTDRVKQGYGHSTPDALPQLYSQSRMMAFRARRQAEETREKERQERQNSGVLVGSSGFGGGITRILGSSGGISFHPGGSILSDSGTLMFDNDDSDDDDSDDMEVEGSSGSFFSHTFGFKREAPDMTKSLKEQLDELDRDSGEEKDAEGGASIVEVDGDSESDRVDGKSPDKGAPPPTKPLPNGDSKEANPPQLTSKPGPDEHSGLTPGFGLLDS